MGSVILGVVLGLLVVFGLRRRRKRRALIPRGFMPGAPVLASRRSPGKDPWAGVP